MEKSLIDAEKVIRDLTAMKKQLGVDAILIDAMIDGLKRQPQVDAVDVVRCKDCKHWLKDVPGCTDFVGRCEWANYMIGAVGYCVYGERRFGNAAD